MLKQSRHDQSIFKTVAMYRIIEAYIATHRYPPSFEDIISKGAFTSTFMIHWHMKRLKEWKLLESQPRLSRTIRLHPVSAAPAEIQRYFEESHAK